MDEDDAPPIVGCVVVGDDVAEHGHHGCDADAAADQHDGRVFVHVEREVSVGVADLELGSLGQVFVEDVGDASGGALGGGGFLLDGDAEVGSVGRVGQAVLSGLVDPQLRDEGSDADELAGLEGRELSPIARREMERDDLVTLIHLPADGEFAPARPSARCAFRFLVEARLEIDEDLCELSVGLSPGVEDGFVDGVAENLFDGREQVLAHDRVLFGCHIQAGMFVADPGDGRAQRTQIVDVRGVSPDRVGEGGGLRARGLMGSVEDVLELGTSL